MEKLPAGCRQCASRQRTPAKNQKKIKQTIDKNVSLWYFLSRKQIIAV